MVLLLAICAVLHVVAAFTSLAGADRDACVHALFPDPYVLCVDPCVPTTYSIRQQVSSLVIHVTRGQPLASPHHASWL